MNARNRRCRTTYSIPYNCVRFFVINYFVFSKFMSKNAKRRCTPKYAAVFIFAILRDYFLMFMELCAKIKVLWNGAKKARKTSPLDVEVGMSPSYIIITMRVWRMENGV